MSEKNQTQAGEWTDVVNEPVLETILGNMYDLKAVSIIYKVSQKTDEKTGEVKEFRKYEFSIRADSKKAGSNETSVQRVRFAMIPEDFEKFQSKISGIKPFK